MLGNIHMIIDFHNDSLLKLELVNGSFFSDHPDICCGLPKMRKAGVSGAFFSIWANPLFFEGSAEQFLKKRVERAKSLLVSAEHNTVIYTDNLKASPDSDNRVYIFLSVEGGFVLDNSPARAELLRLIGIRKLTLTHFQSTEWATCASDDKTGQGLNALGKEIVHSLNRNNIIVDIAHASTRTIIDAAESSSSPIVYSHGGVRELNPNPRCISDDAIRAVASTGGLVGISFFPEHLTPSICEKDEVVIKFWKEIDILKSQPGLTSLQKGEAEIRKLLFEYPKPSVIPGLDNVFKHIEHVVRLVGDDFVSIGSDFDGIPYACKGLEDISKIRALIAVMETAGYSDTCIRKIMGGNIERVITALQQ